ncbi:MAG: hypothetical protein ABIG28_02630 [archaeon]
MKDIFEAKIVCEKCNKVMEQTSVEKKGFKLRAVGCKKCGEKIVHPADLSRLEHYNDLKRKTYNVKLRVVGNSHAISIPKEVVDFINETNQRMKMSMNDMVKLCFEDFGKLSLDFMGGKHRRERWQRIMG